jgi:hypothetical protein
MHRAAPLAVTARRLLPCERPRALKCLYVVLATCQGLSVRWADVVLSRESLASGFVAGWMRQEGRSLMYLKATSCKAKARALCATLAGAILAFAGGVTPVYAQTSTTCPAASPFDGQDHVVDLQACLDNFDLVYLQAI